MGVFFHRLNSKIIELTIESEGWEGESVPYSYTISNENIAASSILDLIINTNSEDLLELMQNTEISGYTQSVGKVIIYAWGEKPTTDIPATLIVRGGY